MAKHESLIDRAGRTIRRPTLAQELDQLWMQAEQGGDIC